MADHPLEALVNGPIPDLSLPSSQGGELSFRQFVGRSPLVLFFYLLNGSPT